MAANLPPDPYKILGVSKDANLPAIRSAHRKLVLKCHPDKVQDEALKAAKQDEFQKVQQAYELLSDDNRRSQYDAQVKLFELRKEMGRGASTPKSNPPVDPFVFEVRTAEPRPNTYTRPSTNSYPGPPRPKSYEDVYDIPLRTAKKSASYESAERKRDEEKQRELRKREEEERERQKWEKERKRAAHVERKKTRDKEKRRDTEERRTRTTRAFVEDDSDSPPPPREKKSSRDKYRVDEEINVRGEDIWSEAARPSASPRVPPSAPLTPKWDGHKEFAAEYMQAARRKATPEEDFHHPGMRRSETFAGPDVKYHTRYATPTKPTTFSPSDDDTPRRSSARRRTSETPPVRTREPLKREKETKRSPSVRKVYPDIVEPPSPPPIPKVPKLKTHSSAPPIVPDFVKPSRSKSEYVKKEREPAIPSLSRSHTFQSGDRDRGRESSRLRNPVQYDSDESETDPPVYSSRRVSRSPRQRRFIIREGRTFPVTTSHRSDMHNVDDEDYSPRDRSESPRGGRKVERPPVSNTSRQAPQRTNPQAYYPPEAAEPVTINARPQMPPRDHRGGTTRGSYFPEGVKYAPAYRHEDILYSPHHSPDAYRKGSDPSTRDWSYPAPRVYAS